MPAVDFSLYLVSDRTQTKGRSLLYVMGEAVAGGLSAIQLREKDLSTSALMVLGRQVLDVARSGRAMLLINDRIDVALALHADGVQLRADSLPVSVARTLLGPTRLIGVSVHSEEEAVQADKDGADFAVLGPMYDTPSKRVYGPPLGLSVLDRATARCRIPILAIGGITPSRVQDVRRAGASGVAVVSAILAAEDVRAVTRQLCGAIPVSATS